MPTKIIISEKKAREFNRMLSTLKTISKGYQTPEQLRRSSEKKVGLEFEEALEMAYENIQQEAKLATNGIVKINLTKITYAKDDTGRTHIGNEEKA